MDSLLVKFSENPTQFAYAIVLISLCFIAIIIAIGVFFRMFGNPFKFISDIIKAIFPALMKELRREAGKAGVIDALIVIFLFIFTIVLLLKPSLKDLLSLENVDTPFFFIL